jgi:TPR repeat protein
MARRRVIGALAVTADDSTEMQAHEPHDPMPLPTLGERANFYLRAVYGDRRFTNEEYSGARDLMLRAMANDIAARSNGRSPDDDSLSLGEQHEGMTAFADASLLLGASEEPHSAGDSQEAAPQGPRAISQRWPLPSFSAGLFPRRMAAAVCAAAAVGALTGYWAAGISARFAPNTAPHDSPLAVQVSPPDASPGSPSGSRIVAEVERELASALNTAQLGPDDIAALVKRAQGLVGRGNYRLARLVLERAAEAKSASAALALARTYDPLMERPAVQPDAPPDMAMARVWYEKAKDLGSTEAAQRLGQLPASVPATK